MTDSTLTTASEIPKAPNALLILAHGSATALTSPHMVRLSQSLAEVNLANLRFNFRYRDQGAAFPSSLDQSVKDYQDALSIAMNTYPDLEIWLSGHSYGGRIASHLLSALCNTGEMATVYRNVMGCIAYALPIHPAGRPNLERWQHLSGLTKPMLFFSGSRDRMASPDLAETLCSSNPACHWRSVPGADHSFNQTQSTRDPSQSVYQWVANRTRDFIAKPPRMTQL